MTPEQINLESAAEIERLIAENDRLHLALDDTALLRQCLDALVPPENVDSDEFINQMGATITALRERLEGAK